jgi:sugar lactone lactonase YvrE
MVPLILNYPEGIAVAPNGDIYVADTNSEHIIKLDRSTLSPVVVAGSGNGNTGDGGDPMSATFGSPQAVAVDAAGNIFIVDTLYNRVRKVDSSTGTIVAFAGDGTQPTSTTSSNGDGDQASLAKLYSPSGVAVDNLGNVYIADTYAHKIRMVNPAGIISTIAGTGDQGSTLSGSALSANLNYPQGIWVDPSGSTIYFSNSGMNTICKISSGTLSTIVGDPAHGLTYYGDGGQATGAGLYNPRGLAIDTWGNLYFADCDNHAIRKAGPDGSIVTVAGNGTSGTNDYGNPASASKLWRPTGVAVDSSGRLFIADMNNSHILRIP